MASTSLWSACPTLAACLDRVSSATCLLICCCGSPLCQCLGFLLPLNVRIDFDIESLLSLFFLKYAYSLVEETLSLIPGVSNTPPDNSVNRPSAHHIRAMFIPIPPFSLMCPLLTSLWNDFYIVSELFLCLLWPVHPCILLPSLARLVSLHLL